MCMIEEADDRLDAWRVQEIARCRKDQRCFECGRRIACGEAYRCYTGRSRETGWQRYPVCAHCCPACDWLFETCSGFVHGFVEEDLREHAEEYRRMDLYRVVAGMRHGWRRKDGRLLPVPRPLTGIALHG